MEAATSSHKATCLDVAEPMTLSNLWSKRKDLANNTNAAENERTGQHALTAKQRTEHHRSHWEATGTAGAHQLARASTAAEAPRHV